MIAQRMACSMCFVPVWVLLKTFHRHDCEFLPELRAPLCHRLRCEGVVAIQDDTVSGFMAGCGCPALQILLFFVEWGSELSSIKVVGGHQQLKAEISRNIHVSHAGALSMLLVVIKVFDDFLKDDTAQILEMADTTLSFTEVV